MSKIKVVATGFRGMLILEEFLKMNLHDIDSVLIAKYETNFHHSSAKIKIAVGEDEIYWYCRVNNPQRVEKFAINHSDEIFSALEDAEFILGITDLGDNDGEGIPPVIADVAQKIGAPIIFVAFTPFKMSPYREECARECLFKLEERAVSVMQLDEIYLVKLVPPKTKFYEGYMMMMKFAAQDVKNILDCYVSRSFALST